MKYRKKPIIVEAEQFINPGKTPEGLCFCDSHPTRFRIAHVHTLEGTIGASPGDWIIKGVKGEFYPCKASVFEATYEKVEG